MGDHFCCRYAIVTFVPVILAFYFLQVGGHAASSMGVGWGRVQCVAVEEGVVDGVLKEGVGEGGGNDESNPDWRSQKWAVGSRDLPRLSAFGCNRSTSTPPAVS